MLLASGTTQAKTKCCCWGMPRTCYVIKHDASVGLHLEAGLALAEGQGVVATWPAHAAGTAAAARQQEQATHQQQREGQVACCSAAGGRAAAAGGAVRVSERKVVVCSVHAGCLNTVQIRVLGCGSCGWCKS